MIQIQAFTFNALQENTYLLYDETGECVVIDPGCYDRSEKEELSGFVEGNRLKVVQLLNTHCHIDHVFGNAYVKDKYGVKLLIHERDAVTLRAVVTYAPVYGFPQYQEAAPDGFIDEGEVIRFGNSSLDILFVPGHAPGHVAFVNHEQHFCIGGDVLFKRSIGRTDLPGGDFNTLIRSIHTKLFPLGHDFVVYPGHGESTTIGEEKRQNPFCAVK
jgi:glyoxylase-like metal-dependent hydrolase (beta-lactamase superfamily II)